jgi:hypothetical protein
MLSLQLRAANKGVSTWQGLALTAEVSVHGDEGK